MHFLKSIKRFLYRRYFIQLKEISLSSSQEEEIKHVFSYVDDKGNSRNPIEEFNNLCEKAKKANTSKETTAIYGKMNSFVRKELKVGDFYDFFSLMEYLKDLSASTISNKPISDSDIEHLEVIHKVFFERLINEKKENDYILKYTKNKEVLIQIFSMYYQSLAYTSRKNKNNMSIYLDQL